MIYEQGIPVVELDGDPLHIDVGIKIPLDLERSSVSPAYLRALRAEVLKHTHALLEDKALQASWATDAMASPNVPATAIDAALTARFGADRVSADPSDREAENTLKSRGHTIVHGGSLPREVWDRVRELELIKPAGRPLVVVGLRDQADPALPRGVPRAARPRDPDRVCQRAPVELPRGVAPGPAPDGRQRRAPRRGPLL